MVRDTLLSLLGQRLGNRTDLTTRMITEVQLLQEVRLEQNSWIPWFLETEMATSATVAGEERLALPTDFLAEIEEQTLWLYDSTQDVVWIPLRKMAYDNMLAKYPDTGRPKAYSLGPDEYRFGPVPDDIYTVKMRYKAKDDILDTNIENKWLKHASDVVLAELGIVMAEKHMQHPKLAETFRNDAGVAWTRLYNKHVAREEENQNRVMEA